eukprot:scaffold2771_cov252-Pinguiococcus_pyrenoidosus.AAC.3
MATILLRENMPERRARRARWKMQRDLLLCARAETSVSTPRPNTGVACENQETKTRSIAGSAEGA